MHLVAKYTQKEMLRKLFTDHALYTKFYIESALQSLPDLDVITTRLLQNQTDIGNFVKPIIGEQNGNILAELLKEHILAAADAVNAVKGGNKTTIDDVVKKVFNNSTQVSKFLSYLNPEKLPYDTVLKMFNMHNQYVIDMTTAHSQKKYDKEIKLFDEYYDQILDFSDTLNSALSVNTRMIYTINYSMIMLILIIIIALIYYFNK